MENRFNTGFMLIQDLIGLKWVPEILETIGDTTCRYTELLENIDYISSTELQRKLQMMVDRNVLNNHKDDYNSYYSLTELGHDLLHVFMHFAELGEKYSSELPEAR